MADLLIVSILLGSDYTTYYKSFNVAAFVFYSLKYDLIFSP